MMFSPFNRTFSYDPWNERGRSDIEYNFPSRNYDQSEEESHRCNCSRCEHERSQVCNCANCRLNKRYATSQNITKKQSNVSQKKKLLSRNQFQPQTNNIVTMGKEAQNKKVDNNKERVDTEQILEVQMDKREQLDETSHKERLINNNMSEIEIQSATLQDKGDDVTMQDKGDDVTIQGDGNEANPTIDQTTLHYNEASESIDNNDSEYLYEQTTVKDLLSQKLNAIKSVEDNMEQTIGQFILIKKKVV